MRGRGRDSLAYDSIVSQTVRRGKERKGVRRIGRRQSGAPWGNLRTIFSAPSDNVGVEVASSRIVAEYWTQLYHGLVGSQYTPYVILVLWL
jgi:hypothetical protein